MMMMAQLILSQPFIQSLCRVYRCIMLPPGMTNISSCQRNFFKLFFTHELVDQLCIYTNSYANSIGNTKPVLYKGWVDVSREEMYRYFGLLFYMAVVNLPVIHLYWSTAALFHGTWARSFISSRRRFQQISSFLKVSNHEMEDKDDKLCKVRFLHDYIRRKCMKLFFSTIWSSQHR